VSEVIRFVLVLEDDPSRIAQFRNMSDEITIVSTVSEAIQLLTDYTWRTLYLDHDLNKESFVDSDRIDCGMELVRWITKNKPIIPSIIVHSANRKGSNLMYQTLKEVGYNVVQSPWGGQFDDRE